MQSEQPLDSGAGHGVIDDLNSKYSHISADPTTHATWAERKNILLVLLISSLLYSIHAGLACTGEATGKIFYGFGWLAADNITVRIGSLYKMICDNDTCALSTLPENAFGNSPKIMPLAVWYGCHLFQLTGCWLSVSFMMFAPHPRTDEVLRYYRYALRTQATLMPGFIAVSYTLLSTLASDQPSYTVGVASLTTESVTMLGISIGLFWASRLVRDPDWVYRSDMIKQERKQAAQMKLMHDKQNLARQKANQSFQKAVGKQGMRAIAMNRFMTAINKADQPSSGQVGSASAPMPMSVPMSMPPSNYPMAPTAAYASGLPTGDPYPSTPDYDGYLPTSYPPFSPPRVGYG